MSARPYHHKPDGTFRNPPGSPERDAPASEYVKFFAGRIRRVNEPRVIPVDHAIAEEEARDAWDRAGDAERLMWLGHAAFLLRMGGRNVLVDPFLGRIAGPGPFGPARFAPPGLSVERLPPVDTLLITHNHYDHLDAWTIQRLARKDRIEVFVPLGLGAFFASAGFRRVRELDWYDAARTGDLEVTSLPAIHWSKRGLRDECRSLWCGYVLSSPDCRVYVSGDTGHGPVFEEIGARLGQFDLGLVGIGAYEPRSVMRASHATPEEAAAIARAVRAHHVMGMHWGSIVLSDEDPLEPPVRFRTAAVHCGFEESRVWRLRIGETAPLPGPGSLTARKNLDHVLGLGDERGDQ